MLEIDSIVCRCFTIVVLYCFVISLNYCKLCSATAHLEYLEMWNCHRIEN